jgi:bifunctional non-homologous end joining protein LigD
VTSLDRYRAKRDPKRTPEPVPPAEPVPSRPRRRRGAELSFVIQEHHARSLHWDFRLERDGVLVSWAVPKGLPSDRGVNHLAVHVEDHPFEYGSFEGKIPDREYGAGVVSIWDRGTYESTEWTDRWRQLDDPPHRPRSARLGAPARARPPDARHHRTTSS